MIQAKRDAEASQIQGLVLCKQRFAKLIGYTRLYLTQRRRLEKLIEGLGSEELIEALEDERQEWEKVFKQGGPSGR